MKTRIVKIGNSRGVRIPKPLLQQAGLEDDVEMTLQGDALIIRPLRRIREGWADAFRAMAAAGDDGLLDPPVPSRFDDDWTW